MEPLPPKESAAKDVTWRKNRSMWARLLRYLRRTRPIPGGLLQLTPNGFRVPRPPQQATYTPPFHPTPGSADETTRNRELTIAPGYLHQPVAKTGNLQIPSLRHWPFMPEIAGRDLDHAEPYTLTLFSGQTTIITLKYHVGRNTKDVGDTSGKGSPTIGSTGIQVVVPSDSVNTAHQHYEGDDLPHARLTAEHYFWDDTNQPEFEAWDETGGGGHGSTPPTLEGVSDGDERYIFAGYYSLDTDGDITERRWFIEENVYVPAEIWLQGGGPDDDTDPGTQTAWDGSLPGL